MEVALAENAPGCDSPCGTQTRGGRLSISELVSALVDALNGDDARACLDGALQLLRARGLAHAGDDGQPWLELQRGARSLSLGARPGATLPDPATRALIAKLLGTALARAAEVDELARVRERADMLSEASFEAIIIHVDGVVIESNRRFRELVGYGPNEPMPEDAMQRHVAPEDIADAVARIRNRVEGEFLLSIVRKDGRRIRAEFCTKQTRLGDRPVRVVALRDVTDRERTAELLRESETRLRRILEATFDQVVISRDGIMIDIGSGNQGFLGYSREQLIGRPVLEIVAPSARDDTGKRIQEGWVGTYASTVLDVHGEPIPIEVISIMSTLDGQPVRVAGLRDMRAARRLEQERGRLALQAERSQRLESLGVLASGIAHDFNNLLVGVLGSAELLLLRLKVPADRALAETIHLAGQRAANLTKQMLAYAGRREVRASEAVDLALLFRELRDLLEAALSKKARLELELEPGSVVWGERATLMQVLMNLLTNASDALDDKPGTIAVSTRHVSEPDASWDDALGATVGPGDWLLVEVRDTGMGMDEPTRRRIFEPFFSTKTRGHGLGLGSCLGIITAHGGAILVESEPGHGSKFSVLLPGSLIQSLRPVAVVATSARPCHVLIIDDEPVVRVYLRRLLELRGFTVEDAADGQAGLAAIARSEPDLVLLDLTMPDLDGVEVARRLRATGTRVPVVLCSGNLDPSTERAMEPGIVQSILHKPFSTEELLAAIERARS